MDLQRLIRGELEKNDQFEEFLKKDQFEKRELLFRFMLTEKNCKIGNKVFCFETEPICADKSKYFYNSRQSKNNQIKSITIGKGYEILDYDSDKGTIKILNDNGKKMWYHIKRFIYDLKIERKEKLERLNSLDDDTLNDQIYLFFEN